MSSPKLRKDANDCEIEKSIAKQASLQTRRGNERRKIQAARRYDRPDFSKAKMSRTNFLAAWEIATL